LKFITNSLQINNWWPITSIAGDLGVPTYTKGVNSYNTVNMGIWSKSYGALNNAQIWENAATYLSEPAWGSTKT
jgi:hypothetical protein